MSLAALTSGGKDSILSMQKMIDAGYNVSHMVCVVPKNTESYMFHSANLNAVPVMAQRCGIEYVKIESKGEKESELDDLKNGLSKLDIDGVIVGAIESVYQKSRTEKICRELNLKMFAPLWKMNPLSILKEVSLRMDSRIILCAADGLGENVLGKKIDDKLIDVLIDVKKKRRINIAGEGGEYESIVIDAPCFSSPLNFSEMKIVYQGMVGKAMIERFW